MQPTYSYRYWTIKGWVERDMPFTPRPSKYQRDNSPLLVTRSFQLSTLASLISSMSKLGHLDPQLMHVVAAHIEASQAQPTLGQALQLVRACHRLDYRQPELLVPVLRSLPLANVTAPDLLLILRLCTNLGLTTKKAFSGRHGITRRLMLGLTQHMDQLSSPQLVQVWVRMAGYGGRVGTGE